ncbi:MAG: TerB family tellurite resistance protein [Alphaproteobacteria bacterium]|nr:MAG: TerB family tellurite resistance protein [Alphaproteobacteria bacterium]
MFDKLRALLGADKDTADDGDKTEPHHLAVAALLIEAASLDGEMADEERTTIARLLSEKFGFESAVTQELIARAAAHHADAVEIFNFTRAIKDTFDAQERIQMIEMLWEVVYADKVLHDYEANLLRRVTGLLHVPDRIAGEAKKRVRTRLGIDAR